MIKGYPLPLIPADPVRGMELPWRPRRSAVAATGSCRYNSPRRPRAFISGALIVSVGLHVGVLFGIGHAKKKIIPPAEGHLMTLTLMVADINELDEPEPTPNDDPGEKPNQEVFAPVQADMPQVPHLDDFVQQIDFASFIERPDLSHAKLLAIPEHIGRGRKIGEGLGAIFNLADLDREPVPVFQAMPVVPASLKSENLIATVRVEFIVNVEGRVPHAVVIESTDRRFDDAAINGVSKWKFKPGMKAGRKVNVRIQVPIHFTVGGGKT